MVISMGQVMEAFPEEGMTEFYLNELVKYNAGATGLEKFTVSPSPARQGFAGHRLTVQQT